MAGELDTVNIQAPEAVYALAGGDPHMIEARQLHPIHGEAAAIDGGGQPAAIQYMLL